MNTAGSAEPPSFGRLALALLLGGGLILALGFLILTGFGDSIAQRVERAPLPLSPRATGYLALRRLIERMPGTTVRELNDPAGLPRGNYDARTDPVGLLIITPSPETVREDLRQLLDTLNGRPALIVMPKWVTSDDPLRRDREIRLRAGDFSMLLPPSYAATFRHGGHAMPLASSLQPPAPAHFPSPAEPTSFTGKDWEPLIDDGHGNMILGGRRGTQTYLLADPDLLNNQGLADPHAAYRALAILAALDPDAPGRVTFDLSLHYRPGSRNLVRLLLVPPFLSVTLTLLAAALLAGIAALSRFGPVRREPRAFALGKRALADNIAALTRLAGRTASAGPAYAEAMRDLAARRVQAPKGLTPQELDAYLDKLGATRRFTDLEARLRAARTETDLLRAAQDMADWRKEVT